MDDIFSRILFGFITFILGILAHTLFPPIFSNRIFESILKWINKKKSIREKFKIIINEYEKSVTDYWSKECPNEELKYILISNNKKLSLFISDKDNVINLSTVSHLRSLMSDVFTMDMEDVVTFKSKRDIIMRTNQDLFAVIKKQYKIYYD